MVESSISAALRRHVLDEAAAVFRGGLDRAHEAQERLQRVANMTQELYLDKWIGTGARAWQQSRRNVWNGVIDGTAPLARAVEDVLSDLRDIVSGPVTPLAVVVSHHWNRTMEVFDKRSSSFDRSMVRGCFDKWVAKTNDFKHKHGISRHFAELRDAFENFVSKSGQDLESLVESCELEVKDMWLDWHRQFMPELPS